MHLQVLQSPQDNFIDKRTYESVKLFDSEQSAKQFRKNSPSDDGMKIQKIRQLHRPSFDIISHRPIQSGDNIYSKEKWQKLTDYADSCGLLAKHYNLSYLKTFQSSKNTGGTPGATSMTEGVKAFGAKLTSFGYDANH